MSSINLYKKKNEASSYIDASITDKGDLQIIRNSFGPGDFETEVTVAVSKTDKDQLLLALLQKIYTGNKNALEDFVTFTRSKNIIVQKFRWP